MNDNEEKPTEEPEIIDLDTLDTKDTKVLFKKPNQLSVPLTDAEKIEVGRLLGERLVEHKRLEDIEKDRRAVARSHKDAREAENASLGEISANGCEDRQVEVWCIAFLSGNRRARVRADTGAVLDSRALTGDERAELLQQPLPLSEGTTDDGASSEPVTIKGVVFADPAAALAFCNDTPVAALKLAGLKGRALTFILDDRPLSSLEALADVRGIGTKALEAIQKGAKAAELPPEAGESAPKGKNP